MTRPDAIKAALSVGCGRQGCSVTERGVGYDPTLYISEALDPETLTQTTCPLEDLMPARKDDAGAERRFHVRQPARKDDAGKAPWSLLPWDSAAKVVDVLEYGCRKYSARDWEKGMEWSRLHDAMFRHMFLWFQMGEQFDAESGLPHLAHIACCALFLQAYELRGVGTDDRPRS